MIVDVFSQHGCLIIKPSSKFVRLLSSLDFFFFPVARREQPSVHVCVHAESRAYRYGFPFGAHTHSNKKNLTFILNEAKVMQVRFQNINRLSRNSNTCSSGGGGS